MAKHTSDLPDIVIGSGPAGVSAATALLGKGRNVLMLDAGQSLEARNAAAWQVAGNTEPEFWDESLPSRLQQPQFDTPQGQTRRFGSDFAMEPAKNTFDPGSEQIGLRSSRALGGLSNLWGAATLPFADSDLAHWPVSSRDLAPHYKAVSHFMPVTGSDTVASSHLGYDTLSLAVPIPAGTQIARIMAATSGKQNGNVRIFPAQQAVFPGCKQCGMCLHGCPWNLIYSSRHTVSNLLKNERFTYQNQSIAIRISSEENARVHLSDGRNITGRKVFVATGVLETARLVFASTDLDQLHLKDSSYAFLPLLHHWRTTPDPAKLPLTTLPQAFALLDDPAVSNHFINAQLYGWNEFFERDLIENYGRRLPGSAPIWRALAKRLVAAQIFLHSEQSHAINLTPGRDGRLIARKSENQATDKTLKNAGRAYAKALRTSGLHGLTFAMRMGGIGDSFHVGGSLPMSSTPKGAATDPLGRLTGFDNIHVVDASVLPSIAATTITFTVMANAHRIASQA